MFHGKITFFHGKITIFNGTIYHVQWVNPRTKSQFSIANCNNLPEGKHPMILDGWNNHPKLVVQDFAQPSTVSPTRPTST